MNRARGQATCGAVINGKALPACSNAPARFESPALHTCPSGSFFDIGRWSCWSCPTGYGRSVHAVDDDRACSRRDARVQLQQRSANLRGPLCPPGSFYDSIRGGECWSCPSGYQRSIHSVEDVAACVVPGGWDHKTAQRHRRTPWPHECGGGSFFDLWDGGGCWTCPSGYGRTAHHINTQWACARSIPEQKSRATLVKRAQCESGEIMDRWTDGNRLRSDTGGGCWTCPAGHARTVHPVYGNAACEVEAGVTYAKATKIQDITCPAGQVFDVTNLTPQDIPSLVAMAAARKNTAEANRIAKLQPAPPGTCWSCPDGYERNANSIKGPDACSATAFGWRTPPFPEPGLFGLEGAWEVLFDITRRHPALIHQALTRTAESVARANRRPVAEVLKKETEILAATPERSTAAASAVFVRLIAALVEPRKASPYEKTLVQSFRTYVIDRRTYFALEAQAQYDVWKQSMDHFQSRTMSRKRLDNLLMLPPAPPDYDHLAMLGSLGIGSASLIAGIALGSVPIVGDVVGVALGAAGNGFGDFADPQKAAIFGARTAAELLVGKAAEQAVSILWAGSLSAAGNAVGGASGQVATGMLTQIVAGGADDVANVVGQAAGHGARSVASLGGSLGPQIIIGVAMMVIQLAIDQVVRAEEAPKKLASALATAKSDPNLARLAATGAGMTELITYWSYATAGERKPPAHAKTMAEYQALASRAAASRVGSGTGNSGTTRAVAWSRLPGAAIDIGVGANGAVWHIGTNKVPGGYGIYRWTGSGWSGMPGGAVRVAVDPQGNAWVTNDARMIFRWNGRQWVTMPGLANDLAIGANGAVWHIGTDARPGGYGIYRWDGDKWVNVPGGATQIAVDPKGNAWVVNDRRVIFRWDGRQWHTLPGQALDIGVGANGTVWVTGSNQVSGGQGLYYYTGSGWTPADGGLTVLAVGPDGKLWGANSRREIWRMQ